MSGRCKYILLLICSVIALGVYSQDARIAHPFLWYGYYNPAYCGSEGLFKCDLGAQINYTHKPSMFIDGHFSAEIGFGVKNATLGFGLTANNEYQGNGLLNVATLNPAFSVGLKLYDRNGVYSTLRVGVSGDVSSSHINKDKMVLGDQLDVYYGKVLPESAELKYINNETVWSGDMSAGIFGQTTISSTVYKMPIIINYGFSVAHLIGFNNPSFYSSLRSVYTPQLYYRRFSVQLEYSHPYISRRNTHMYFTGYGIYEYQGGMNDIQLGFVAKIQRFMGGLGIKVEKYRNYTVTNFLLHFVYSQPLTQYSLMRIAYSFETPVTQGSISNTTIHSISLHFVVDYQSLIRKRNKCKDYTHPSDAAWYEMNNTFPNGR